MVQPFVELILLVSLILLCLATVSAPFAAFMGYAITHRRWPHARLLWSLFGLGFLALMCGAALECAVTLTNTIRPDTLSAGSSQYDLLTKAAISLLFGGLFLTMIISAAMYRVSTSTPIAELARHEPLHKFARRDDRNGRYGIGGREVMKLTLGAAVLYFIGIGVLSTNWGFAALFAGLITGAGLLLTVVITIATHLRR